MKHGGCAGATPEPEAAETHLRQSDGERKRFTVELASGRPLSPEPTYVLVTMMVFGTIVTLSVMWFAISGLLARRRAFQATATVLDVHRHSASGEDDGSYLRRSDWFPVVEFAGPDVRTRQVTLDAVKSRPVIGGTIQVLCDPDDPSRVTIRSFTGTSGPTLCLGLLLGPAFTTMAVVTLLHRFQA